MPMIQPLVSILIRSMDRPTLQRALRSAAAQTWPNLEIVVVAACGALHRPLAESFDGRPLRLVVPEPDRRLSRPEAANLALESARGEWLNFLDDDDELFPYHLDALLRTPRSDERIIYSRSEVRDAAGRPTGVCGAPGFRMRMCYEALMTPNAMLFHRSLVDAGVRFDCDFPIYEDHDFFIACAAHSRLLFVDRPTCVWNAQAGDSGCGHGANAGIGRRGELSKKIQDKWAAQFAVWSHEPGALLHTGRQLLQGGEIGAARDCLEKALALAPGDVNALNLCGMANFHAGDRERAEMLLRKALQHLPRHTGLKKNLALIRAGAPMAR